MDEVDLIVFTDVGLQWGRARLSAETWKMPRGVEVTECFNGAALV